MDYRQRWHIIEPLGEGGQGKVYRVLDDSKFRVDDVLSPSIQNSIASFSGILTPEKRRENLESFRKAILDFIRMEDPDNQGALKILHEPKEARDANLAKTRIRGEIEAMFSISHPNLLKILDYDPDSKWFVSEIHPKGTLINNKSRFAGDFIGALKAFRPLVEGVAKLHEAGFVHRDIKPENVFLGSQDNLILGDFGLVFFNDPQRTRVSGTWENVGSRDWMPPWAMSMRIEEIKPTFDVFCLGKLLWAMVSQTPILQLWYFERPQFNLERMFPNAPSIEFANPFLRKCIVENENKCLPNATDLLEEINKVLAVVSRSGDLIDDNIERSCKVCGIGKYEQIIDRDLGETEDFGINPKGDQTFKIFTCNHCGHVQLFSFFGPAIPSAWD